MNTVNNKYINKLNKIKKIFDDLDDVDNYIKEKQHINLKQLNEYIRILQLSNTYVSAILEN